jgi:hypothetical protein
MKRIANILLIACLLAFAVIIFSIGFAQPKVQADLGVEGIYAYSCACDLPGVDALYMNKITVEVSAKFKARLDDSAVIGTLKVTYYDLMTGRLETRAVMLQAYLFRGRSSNVVEVVSSAVLIKKSVGVRAEVQASGAISSDPNPANNVKKENVCRVRLL